MAACLEKQRYANGTSRTNHTQNRICRGCLLLWFHIYGALLMPNSKCAASFAAYLFSCRDSILGVSDCRTHFRFQNEQHKGFKKTLAVQEPSASPTAAWIAVARRQPRHRFADSRFAVNQSYPEASAFDEHSFYLKDFADAK